MKVSAGRLPSLGAAGRLVSHCEKGGVGQKSKKILKRDRSAVEPKGEAPVSSPDFIKIEKNLAALGFFTPSSKKIKNVKEKTISFMRVIDGNKVDTRVAIVPAAKYGLPITSDQDTYFAIFKIATEIHRQKGRVTNPIGFTSAEILHL